MNTIRSFVKRHSFITFTALSYLLSWWSVPFADGRIIPYGPALAAVIVLAITSGRPGLRNLWHRITNWRISWYWYVIGPGLVTSYVAGAYLINLSLGASVTSSPQLPSMAILLQLFLLGGLWEEPGWSGYALPTIAGTLFRAPKRRIDGHPCNRCCSSHLAFAAGHLRAHPLVRCTDLFLSISIHDFLALQWKRWQRFGCDGIPFRLQH